MSAIVGGQAIAALNPENVSVNIGIVVVCVGAFAASILGYRALHWWERWALLPNLVAIVVAVGCGGKHLHLQSDLPPPTPFKVLTYGGLIAGYFLTFGGIVSDYSIYHDPEGPKYV